MSSPWRFLSFPARLLLFCRTASTSSGVNFRVGVRTFSMAFLSFLFKFSTFSHICGCPPWAWMANCRISMCSAAVQQHCRKQRLSFEYKRRPKRAAKSGNIEEKPVAIKTPVWVAGNLADFQTRDLRPPGHCRDTSRSTTNLMGLPGPATTNCLQREQL